MVRYNQGTDWNTFLTLHCHDLLIKIARPGHVIVGVPIFMLRGSDDDEIFVNVLKSVFKSAKVLQTLLQRLNLQLYGYMFLSLPKSAANEACALQMFYAKIRAEKLRLLRGKLLTDVITDKYWTREAMTQVMNMERTIHSIQGHILPACDNSKVPVIAMPIPLYPNMKVEFPIIEVDNI